MASPYAPPMRMGCAAAAILIATAACGASSAAPSTSTTAAMSHCGPSQARTLAADRSARIYLLAHRVYGCARRSYLLGPSRPRLGQPRISHVALAGTMAAYAVTRSGVDTAMAEVIVRNLADGRTRRSLGAVTQPVGPESFETVNSVVVRADGAVAWIGGASSIIRHNTELEVDRADRRGERRLDSGPAIATGSLRLHRSRLSWRHGSATRAATLD